MHMSMQVSTQLYIVVTATRPIPDLAHISRICDATSLLKTLKLDKLTKNAVVNV